MLYTIYIVPYPNYLTICYLPKLLIIIKIFIHHTS